MMTTATLKTRYQVMKNSSLLSGAAMASGTPSGRPFGPKM